MANDHKIKINDFQLWFGTKQVLKDVNMAVGTKRITALMGPSGCGKSTLLRSINRLNDLVPNTRIEGSVHIDDLAVYGRGTNVVDLRRRVGMVFQKPNPFPKSIFDNIAYGLKLEGNSSKSEIEAIVEDSLRSSALWPEVCDRLDTPALDLSGGQQQRLCIARTIAVRPDVVLMDEPCSALDPVSTRRVEELMLELKDRYTIIVVTHNMQQARRVADDTGVMYLGEMVEAGDTAGVFENPSHEITQSYVRGEFG